MSGDSSVDIIKLVNKSVNKYKDRSYDNSNNSSNNSSSCDTIDAIKEICDDVTYISKPCRDSSCRSGRYNPGDSTFSSLVTPLINLCPNCVEFMMRRKNKTVTLQWQPFTGTLSASGVCCLTVCQSICPAPPYMMSMPIFILYKGVPRVVQLTIDPHSNLIRFYLNTDGSTSNTFAGDAISVPGGAVTYIVTC